METDYDQESGAGDMDHSDFYECEKVFSDKPTSTLPGVRAWRVSI